MTGGILGQPGCKLEENHHQKINNCCQNNDRAGGGFPQLFMDQIPDGKCERINKCAGVDTESGDPRDFKAPNVRQQLGGNIYGYNDNCGSGNGLSVD
jgi:hypothetical protein